MAAGKGGDKSFLSFWKPVRREGQINLKNEPAKGNPIYRLSENAAFEAFDDGALILNLEKVTFTELNPTARDILQATDGKNSLMDVATILAKEYEIELETALADTQELLDDLLQQGLIEVVKTGMTEEKG